MYASQAFRRAWVQSNPADMTNDALWGAFNARRGRYAMLWNLYQSTVYNTQNRALLQQYDLYQYTREVANPYESIVDFYGTYVWGGYLDSKAGDNPKSAIPIMTEDQRLRDAIARVWKTSRWQTNKALVPRMGAALGDVFLFVVDDVKRKDVRIDVVNPGLITDMKVDEMGNVKALIISYQRTDDVSDTREVTYTEKITRDGVNVVWELFKNDAPYAWGNESSTWAMPYGFVPVVHIPHKGIGTVWGQSAAGASIPLFLEVDELASIIDDQLRKLLNAPWLFSGIQEPRVQPETSVERDNMPVLYSSDPAAKAQPLVAPMPINEAAGVFTQRMDTLRERFPELQIGNSGGGQVRSGDAERERHQAAANRALEARAGYDEALLRALQMSISIGGWRGYDGFAGFSLESYDRGQLAFDIMPRPVFQRSDAEELDNVAKQAGIISQLTNAGGSLSGAAILAGLNAEDVTALTDFGGEMVQ